MASSARRRRLAVLSPAGDPSQRRRSREAIPPSRPSRQKTNLRELMRSKPFRSKEMRRFLRKRTHWAYLDCFPLLRLKNSRISRNSVPAPTRIWGQGRPFFAHAPRRTWNVPWNQILGWRGIFQAARIRPSPGLGAAVAALSSAPKIRRWDGATAVGSVGTALQGLRGSCGGSGQAQFRGRRWGAGSP
jgi:hypothetical protein